MAQIVVHIFAQPLTKSGSFLCVFKKTQGQPKKTRSPIEQNTQPIRANSDFTKKSQEISYPNYNFSWG